MEEATRARIESFWARLVMPDPEQRLHRTNVIEHGPAMFGYPGILAVLRQRRVFLSAPSDMTVTITGWRPTSETVIDPSWWAHHLPEWSVLGPSIHSFLDHTEGLPTASRACLVTVSDVADALQARVTPEEWAEAGFARDDVEAAWLLDDDQGRPVAASNLTLFDGTPADVGVLVAGDARGQGYAAEVGMVSARCAVDECGLARWRSLATNMASRRTAARLGFEDDCTQLAIRP